VSSYPEFKRCKPIDGTNLDVETREGPFRNEHIKEAVVPGATYVASLASYFCHASILPWVLAQRYEQIGYGSAGQGVRFFS
jgi:hypothetical protein